ncbi:MAG: CpcT/CpeT family chromophore lyase, partial [Pseudomonadota bacterium]
SDLDAVRGAYSDVSKLAGLTPETARKSPAGCDVYWKRSENHFDGYMRQDACRVTSSRTGETIVINDMLLLTDSALWINDQARTEAGEYVFGNKANVPNKLLKARPFQCWVGMLRGAEHGDSGEGMSDWWFKRGLWIHDRGGELQLKTEDGAPADIYLKLRRVSWPHGTRRPSMTLYVHETDNDRALSYAWTEYEADRIGVNLRWLQASCTHTPEAAYGP